MDCRTIQDLFSGCVEQELEARLEMEFKHHLRVCPGCAEEFGSFQKTMSLLWELEQERPPVDLLSSVYAKLEQRSLTARLAAWFRAGDFAFPLPVAATVVVVMFTVLVLLKPGPFSSHFLPQESSSDVAVSPVVDAPSREAEAGREDGGREVARGEEKAARATDKEQEFFSLIPPVVPLPEQNGAGRPALAFSPFSRQNRVDENINFVTTGPSQPGESLSPLGDGGGLNLMASQHATSAVGRLFTPDITVNVQTSSLEDHASLYRQLMNEEKWKTHPYENDLLLVFVHPEHLPKIQRLLKSQKAIFSPAIAAEENFILPKKLMVVAVHLK